MQWWDDLWLNEGFASWAENWSANEIFPHYQMWDQFVTDHLSSALKLDGLQSSHPIQVPIAHAEEVEQASLIDQVGVEGADRDAHVRAIRDGRKHTLAFLHGEERGEQRAAKLLVLFEERGERVELTAHFAHAVVFFGDLEECPRVASGCG